MNNLLKVQSADGLELSLEIAELGSRSYAFIIDWHFRFLLALAWWLGAWILFTGAGRESVMSVTVDADSHWRAYLLFLPPVAIYLLYHPIVELLLGGRTPGKRMAGVRVVTTEGQPPDVFRILVRNLFRLVDSLPVFYVVGCIACVVTGMRVRIGDMAAGTVLVYEENVMAGDLERSRSIVAGTNLSHSDHALLLDIMDRWSALDRKARITIATRFLASIGREVPGDTDGKWLEKSLHSRLQQLSGTPTS